jgi:hypothetical protein
MAEKEKKDYQGPELIEHENLEEITKGVTPAS